MEIWFETPAVLKSGTKSVTRAIPTADSLLTPLLNSQELSSVPPELLQQFAKSIYIRFINAMLFARYDPVYMARTQVWP